jgi:hypothetical protein
MSAISKDEVDFGICLGRSKRKYVVGRFRVGDGPERFGVECLE